MLSCLLLYDAGVAFILITPFFFNHTATTEIYTLSLHDALPISPAPGCDRRDRRHRCLSTGRQGKERRRGHPLRSEEHTSELQSQSNLVCRLLLEKKKILLPF